MELDFNTSAVTTYNSTVLIVPYGIGLKLIRWTDITQFCINCTLWNWTKEDVYL